jgi:hypothetical protein
VVAFVKLFIDSIEKTLYEADLTKEGERAIDQIRLKVPKVVNPEVNQEVKYLQDMVDIGKLIAVYNLQGNVEDEGGYGHDGVATSLTYGTDSWDGQSATFNGSSSQISIPHNTRFDFSGKFDIYIWAKWTATTTGMYLMSKRIEGDVFQPNVYQNNVFTALADGGLAIQVNATTAGDVKVLAGGSTITSSTAGFNDGNWHLIRVSRNASNVVTLYVDTLSKGTATITGTMSTTQNMYVGSDFSGGYFNGSIARVRFYSGILGGQQPKNIYNKRNPRSVVKFGGRITKLDSELTARQIIAQSFGKILAETEINGQVFNDRTPEYIVENLVEAKTTLTFQSSSGVSGITLKQYVADGKLVDVLKDLSAITNRVFYTTGSKLLVFDDVKFNDLDLVLTHGNGLKISDDGFDDTEIVNDLTVLGQNLQYNTVQTFNGDNSNLVFTLDNNPVVMKVTIGGTESTPETDYDFDTMNRTVTFGTAPATGSNNISVEYTFEKPLYIRGTKQDSINTYGVHAKRLNLPWISSREDGVRFVQAYLNRYKDISQKVKVTSAKLYNSLQENDIVHLKNFIKGIDGDFVIKSITWKYPEMTTLVEVGEYYFDFFEYDKEIVAKIHDLESTVTRVKDVREYESPEESFVFASRLTMFIDRFKLTESLSMTTTSNIYDKAYNTYSMGSVSTTFQPNLFQSNVFRTAGFTNSATSATYGSRTTGAVYVSG